MSIKSELIAALIKDTGFVSGQRLSSELYCSRNAVWKTVKALSDEGFEIESRPSVGYRLNADRLPLCRESVAALIGKDAKELDITVAESVESTNDSVKELAAKGAAEGTVVVASQQTKGKGRLGRSFYSPKGTGIYLSVLLRPKLTLSQCLLITTAAAVATAEAIEAVSGKRAMIKWVNDVFIDGKKVCGILTEASTDVELGGLSWAVAGIGINLVEPEGGFPEEIKDTAGAVFDSAEGIPTARLCAEVIGRFMALYHGIGEGTFLSRYKDRSLVLGRKINVLRGGKASLATAVDIDEACRLLVRYDSGDTEWLSTGEVSIRPNDKKGWTV